MNPITGTLVDRFGGKPLVVASQLLQAIGFLGYLTIGSIPLLFGTAFLVTADNRVFYAACTALIAEVADYDCAGSSAQSCTFAGTLCRCASLSALGPAWPWVTLAGPALVTGLLIVASIGTSNACT